jgi:hypothetical protein
MIFNSRPFAPVVAVALLAAASASPVCGGEHALKAVMSGPVEAPPGDPDGAGKASFHVDTAKGQICYNLQVSKIAPATMAHIHKAPPGKAGPVVIPLKAPDKDGKVSDCASADAKALADIMANPGEYYVNVHNAEYPGGAVRGQLSN